ncbi:NUDIX domain-containing protein [Streptomyces sp. RB6PN25]|uniref:NUDIX domain-containing protein n=1 Tax=Streptomyces humicola TaxID=2953240 RepID=A0ABT1PWB1_9ACTN|nr:NUDIX domain-containing protein [Streptomyces humicola]MCQ4081963.1 NUDIX domain-containing protein [Streptomyces humicola]
MAITADHIRTTLGDYLDEHPEEKDSLAPVVELLDAGADLTSRKEFRGHATAGAILAGPDGRILHIHHLALDKWLLPGGHLEPQDETLLDAARRELTEETGIPTETVTPISDRPVHIDVHPIPANDAKGEPDHQHVDFRFLFRTTADVRQLQTEEVTDAAWRDVDTLGDDRLRHRVAQALR